MHFLSQSFRAIRHYHTDVCEQRACRPVMMKGDDIASYIVRPKKRFSANVKRARRSAIEGATRGQASLSARIIRTRVE
jgi:hypothetical protein